MPDHLPARLRSSAYRAYTRLPHGPVGRLATTLPGDRALGAVERALGNGPVMVRSGVGRGLRLDGRAFGIRHVQAHGLVRGELEPSVQEALRRYVLPGTVVCDIGANLGFFSLLLARLVGEHGAVHAFEPSPPDAQSVRRNAALNGFSNITVHEAAVGARSGRGEFLLVGERSWSHLRERGYHAQTRDAVDVEIVALDDVEWPGGIAPSLVKMDIEGSEVQALAGMERLLREARPVVVCELHETNGEVHDALTAAGYEVENIDGPEPVLEAGAVHVVGRPPR